MKSLLIISLFLLGCIQSAKEESKSTVKVRYRTSAHDIDVIYCKEDGSIGVEFGIYKFEQELFIESGQKACLSVTKKDSRNTTNARVYIYINDSLVADDYGEMAASAEYKL